MAHTSAYSAAVQHPGVCCSFVFSMSSLKAAEQDKGDD